MITITNFLPPCLPLAFAHTGTHAKTHQFLSLSCISCVYMYFYVCLCFVACFSCNPYYVSRSRGNEKISCLPSKTAVDSFVEVRNTLTIRMETAASRGRNCECFKAKCTKYFLEIPRKPQFNSSVIREKNGLNINRNQRQQIRCWQTEEKPVTRTFLIFPDNHEKDGTIVSRTKMHALLCSRSRGRERFPFRVFFLIFFFIFRINTTLWE